MLVVKWVLQILRINRLGLRFVVSLGMVTRPIDCLFPKQLRAVGCGAKLPLLRSSCQLTR